MRKYMRMWRSPERVLRRQAQCLRASREVLRGVSVLVATVATVTECQQAAINALTGLDENDVRKRREVRKLWGGSGRSTNRQGEP
jgi:hypothetical protein